MKKAAFVMAGIVGMAGLWLIGCGKSGPNNQASKTKPQANKANQKPQRHEIPPCPEADKTKVVAEVDGIKIMKCDVYDRIHRLSPYIRRRYTTLQRKKEFVDRMVRFELLAAEAARQGLDKNPDVVRAKKEIMVQKLVRKMFRDKFKPADVTEQELKKFYEEHKADYNKPAMVRISHILVKSKAAADKILAEAKKLDVRGFRKLARDKSMDEATKIRGGDLRYFAATDTALPKPLVEAAFKLQKRGDVAGPIKTAKGWHIICLTGKRPPIKREFAQVKQLLRNRILREKRALAQKEFVDQLKKKTKPFEVFEKKLELVKVCKSEGKGLVGGHPPRRVLHPPRRPGMHPRHGAAK